MCNSHTLGLVILTYCPKAAAVAAIVATTAKRCESPVYSRPDWTSKLTEAQPET